jgi:PTS system nitrogen regulatory IIA component
MLVDDLISTETVLPDVRTSSKKRLLEVISQALARNDDDLSSREIFESLCARERLGSTGLGNGVAIPHGRVSGSSSVQAVFIRLAKPLAFDAVDGKPVDLLFALAVPENCTSDHLKLLSEIAQKFSDAELLERLRAASDASELVRLLSGTRH